MTIVYLTVGWAVKQLKVGRVRSECPNGMKDPANRRGTGRWVPSTFGKFSVGRSRCAAMTREATSLTTNRVGDDTGLGVALVGHTGVRKGRFSSDAK